MAVPVHPFSADSDVVACSFVNDCGCLFPERVVNQKAPFSYLSSAVSGLRRGVGMAVGVCLMEQLTELFNLLALNT